jgi:D-alanyl-D-alanine carboxypeptidase
MNDEALRLDLDDTHFVNPHGLDAPGHYASAYDLARLALIAWQEPRLARLLGTSAVVSDGFRLQHGHALIGRYPGVLGGKTGRTRGCRSCLLTIAERDGRRVAIVLLRATREQIVAETTTLLDWSFRQPLPSPRPRPASGERSPACWRPVWRGLCAGLMPLGL